MARELSERTRRRYGLYGWPQKGPGADEEDYPERAAWPALRVRIGTSGWAYPHWKGRFYPASCPTTQHLAWYGRRLPTLEVNCTYYRLPPRESFARWRDAVPPGFLFTIKAPGAITHDKRLVDVRDELEEFLDHARELHDRLGLLLFQFPPSFKADLPTLSRFLDLLPRDVRCAFELRHKSWFAHDTYMLLAQHEQAFVVHDFAKKGTPLVETAPHVYLRLHGPSGRYRGSYDVPTLFTWAEQVRAWVARGFEVFVAFNNDERGHGPRNAALLRALIGESAAGGAQNVAAQDRAPGIDASG
jgi:uncharacterized protein YecE (DUF72 family)